VLFADRGGVYCSVTRDGERGNFALAGFVEPNPSPGKHPCSAAAISRATDAQDAPARLGAARNYCVCLAPVRDMRFIAAIEKFAFTIRRDSENLPLIAGRDEESTVRAKSEIQMYFDFGSRRQFFADGETR